MPNTATRLLLDAAVLVVLLYFGHWATALALGYLLLTVRLQAQAIHLSTMALPFLVRAESLLSMHLRSIAVTVQVTSDTQRSVQDAAASDPHWETVAEASAAVGMPTPKIA